MSELYSIKPLRWVRFRKNGFQSTTKVVNPENQWTARYHVGDSLSGRTTDWFYWFDGKGERRAKTKEAAIAACDRDNQRRIRMLLSPRPDSEPTKPTEPALSTQMKGTR